jgi:hypothetical protein
MPNIDKSDLLRAAILSDDRSQIESLAANGYDLNKELQDGITPLHEACAWGSTAVAEFLISCVHANVEAKTNDGSTPLHLAAHEGRTEVVQMLIDKGGANIEARGGGNFTPLYLAAQQGHSDIVNLLINKGANVFATTHGHTATQIAAQKLYLASAIQLCKVGNGWLDMIGRVFVAISIRAAIFIVAYILCRRIVVELFGVGFPTEILNMWSIGLVLLYVLHLVVFKVLPKKKRLPALGGRWRLFSWLILLLVGIPSFALIGSLLGGAPDWIAATFRWYCWIPAKIFGESFFLVNGYNLPRNVIGLNLTFGFYAIVALLLSLLLQRK